ncbi:allergen Tha p 1-like [Aricia agestis]|uniref:allergen Tha p 1-like n=1 Tax=Aricia agestis TaxID=91739 RepID=UPI001C203665|nr:allergen Tha p 1-like [Aricia agestis]
MKQIILLSIIALCSAYTDINDNEDVNAVVNNPTELKKHIACYLDKGPCTQDTLLYKTHLREVVDDACRECNDAERHLVRVFLKGLKEHFPSDYNDYLKKYDPEGIHVPKLLASVGKF